jgi:very-short-patch-repair endonuclease
VADLKIGRYYFPYNPELLHRARALRKNMTPAERKLWHGYLRTLRPRILRQRPIDHFIVDFYCAQLKLVIEIDGSIHFTPSAQAYDQHRTERLESYGITVIRFTNDQVLHNFEIVCEAIATYIQQNLPPETAEEQ